MLWCKISHKTLQTNTVLEQIGKVYQENPLNSSEGLHVTKEIPKGLKGWNMQLTQDLIKF